MCRHPVRPRILHPIPSSLISLECRLVQLPQKYAFNDKNSDVMRMTPSGGSILVPSTVRKYEFPHFKLLKSLTDTYYYLPHLEASKAFCSSDRAVAVKTAEKRAGTRDDDEDEEEGSDEEWLLSHREEVARRIKEVIAHERAVRKNESPVRECRAYVEALRLEMVASREARKKERKSEIQRRLGLAGWDVEALSSKFWSHPILLEHSEISDASEYCLQSAESNVLI